MITSDAGKEDAIASPPSPLELVRMVAKHMRSIRLGLAFAVVLVILAFSNFVLFLAYEDSTAWLMWIIFAFWMASGIVGCVGIFFLRDLFRASGAFKSWGDKYRQYALLTSFEFQGPTDSRFEQDVVNRLLTAYPDLEEEVSRKQAKVVFSGKVQGKMGLHPFDVVIETKAGRLWLVRFRADDAEEMAINELNSLYEEIRDIAARRKHYRIEVILVSKPDYSDEAVTISRNGQKWRDVGKARILEVLVRKTDAGFYITSVSDDSGKQNTGLV